MPVTISDGTDSTSPAVVDGYASSRPSNNIVHAIIDRAAPEVTLRPAGLRTGTLSLVYSSLDDALECEAIHSTGLTLTLTSDDLPAIGMDYVPTDDIEVEQDSTRVAWIVSVPFQEVTGA